MIRMPMRRFHSPLLDRTYGGIYALHMENLHDIAITTRGLTKVYGGIKRVDDVSLSVRQGEIYGLIGRNGAGKTTLLRMLLGIASPTSGEVAFFGESSPHALAKARSKCGALIEQPAFYPRLNAKENLDIYARATGAPRPDVSALLSLVGLGDCGRKSVRNFSLGMKQRLAIAMALIGDPDMLFLDEPVNGLDPAGIMEIRELIMRLNRERGVTVVISSHLLGELGRVATAYGVMKEGKLVAELRGEALAALASPRIRVVVPERERAEKLLTSAYGREGFVMRGNTADITDAGTDIAKVSSLFAEHGVALMELRIVSGDLESAFVDML